MNNARQVANTHAVIHFKRPTILTVTV